MKQDKSTNEPRFEGANWDQPVVKVKRNGATTTIRRKVLTKGVKTLSVGGVMKEVKELMRRGHEVRLADENGNEVIRLFPLASPDCKTMYPVAQTMGVSKDWLVGKILRVSYRDHEIKGAQVQSLINEAKMHSDAKRRCVSPDTVVTCPNCGTEFRVGRPLADAA